MSELYVKEVEGEYNSSLDYPNIPFISLSIEDNFGEIPTLTLSTYKELSKNKKYVVIYKSDGCCIFHGIISACRDKKSLINEKMQSYNEYLLKCRPSKKDSNADKFKDINNPDTKNRFFEKFPSHILHVNGEVIDLTTGLGSL